MNQEIIDCLKILELKLHSLLQDIRNIRANIENPQLSRQVPEGYQANFFNALRGEDDAVSSVGSAKTSEFK